VKKILGLGALILVMFLAYVPGTASDFVVSVRNTQNTAGTARFTCGNSLAVDRTKALFQWPLSDATGSLVAADISGQGHTGTYHVAVVNSATTPIACPRDSGTAWSLNGNGERVWYPVAIAAPQTFTEEIWFKIPAGFTSGGHIMNFGSNPGSSSSPSPAYDREIWVEPNGTVNFGVFNGGRYVVSTPSTKNYQDGQWHHVAATLSSAGMKLYVDGVLKGTNPNTVAGSGTGYWRVGWDNGWGSPNFTLKNFTGQLRYAAVYTVELSASRIAAHYLAGSP
jgi:hypothetical protein